MIELTPPADINGGVLHQEMVAAGLPLEDEDDVVLADGMLRVRNLDESHRDAAQSVVDAHSPPPPPPDPDAELANAIEGASTLAELKDALLGNLGQGRAAGRPV